MNSNQNAVMSSLTSQNPFTGRIGEEYDFLGMMCPNVVVLTQKLGATIAAWRPGDTLQGLEIGCGTGLSTLSLLSQCEGLHLRAFDASSAMLKQARANLAAYVDGGRVEFIESDALAFLQEQADASVDVVASNYAIHNFLNDYRDQVFAEILRVLKPGGIFVNGDRFAIDDPTQHLASTQADIRHWFKTFGELKRYDLLEDWVVHLLSDESPDHIMHTATTLSTLQSLGFAEVHSLYREGVDMLITATKPA